MLSLLTILLLTTAVHARNYADPHTFVTTAVSDFKEIRIIGVNSDYTFGKWGYPGITITQNVVDWGGVSYKSIINEEAYYTNMSITGFNQSSLSITASNRVDLVNCKIKNLSLSPYNYTQRAYKCEYNLGLTAVSIDKLSIKAFDTGYFKTDFRFGVKIKNTDYIK